MTATRTRRPSRYGYGHRSEADGEIRLSSITTLAGRWHMYNQRQPHGDYLHGDRNGAMREIELALVVLLQQSQDTVHASLVQGVL